MAGSNYVADTGFQADGAIAAFTAVKWGSDAQHVAAQATLGGACVGVSQTAISASEATAGKALAVRYMGITRMKAGSALATLGTPVRADTSGRAVVLAATTAKQNVVGLTMSVAGAADDIILVLLTPGAQHTTV